MFKYCLIVFAAVAVVFIQARNFDFVRYDDYEYVFENPHMRDGLTVENVCWAFKSRGYASNWHPLAWISLMADVSIDRLIRGGQVPSEDEWRKVENPVSHIMHIHNVLLHAANAVLLFLLMVVAIRKAYDSRLCSSPGELPKALDPIWPLALALLWALHPLRVEVVCWVSERKELTSVFFMLLTLIAYFGIEGESRGRCERFALCNLHSLFLVPVVPFALALLAKPVAVSLPAVTLAWDWAVRRKIRWGRFVVLTLMALATIVLTMASQQQAMDMGKQLTAVSRLMSVLGGPAVYLKQTFWPVGLSPVYGLTATPDWPILIGGALIVLICVVLVVLWLVRKNTWTGIGALAVAWIYVGLIPMLGIVKVGTQEHSDRYTYWIGCGVCVVVALLVAALRPYRPQIMAKLAAEPGRDEWPSLRKMILGVMAALVAVLAFLTHAQSAHWAGAIPLFRHALANSWDAETAGVLARELERQGGWEEAEHWLRGTATRTHDVRSYLNLALFLLRKPSGGQLGESTCEEVLGLVDSVLAAEPQNECAQGLKQRLEKIRK